MPEPEHCRQASLKSNSSPLPITRSSSNLVLRSFDGGLKIGKSLCPTLVCSSSQCNLQWCDRSLCPTLGCSGLQSKPSLPAVSERFLTRPFFRQQSSFQQFRGDGDGKACRFHEIFNTKLCLLARVNDSWHGVCLPIVSWSFVLWRLS